MSCFTCSHRGVWRELSRAAAKSASAGFRRIGALSQHPQWPARATICARCPLRVDHRGTAYCGKPFLDQIDRHPTEGCGCPITAKAKDPAEHCPLDAHHSPAVVMNGTCSCKWCRR